MDMLGFEGIGLVFSKIPLEAPDPSIRDFLGKEPFCLDSSNEQEFTTGNHGERYSKHFQLLRDMYGLRIGLP